MSNYVLVILPMISFLISRTMCNIIFVNKAVVPVGLVHTPQRAIVIIPASGCYVTALMLLPRHCRHQSSRVEEPPEEWTDTKLFIYFH